jgi:hypothetical protein
MYRRIGSAPAGLQPVELGLFVMCFWAWRIGNCRLALGGTLGSASCSMVDWDGVLLSFSVNRSVHGLLATCSCVLFALLAACLYVLITLPS